jgi:hypothetical protein
MRNSWQLVRCSACLPGFSSSLIYLSSAATVLGACGIAYALRFIRAATQGGIEIGFDAATSQLIAAQTVKVDCQLP